MLVQAQGSFITGLIYTTPAIFWTNYYLMGLKKGRTTVSHIFRVFRVMSQIKICNQMFRQPRMSVRGGDNLALNVSTSNIQS